MQVNVERMKATGIPDLVAAGLAFPFAKLCFIFRRTRLSSLPATLPLPSALVHMVFFLCCCSWSNDTPHKLFFFFARYSYLTILVRDNMLTATHYLHARSPRGLRPAHKSTGFRTFCCVEN